MLQNRVLLFFFLCFLTAHPFATDNSTTHNPQLGDNNMENVEKSGAKPFNGEAKWIWTATRTRVQEHHTDDHRVAYFRRTFQVAHKKAKLTVHVSADSRYILWCNGKLVGRGPAKGDIAHHFYDTYELDDLLKVGRNVIAAHVVCFSPSWPDYGDGGPPCSIMTATNGFVLDGVLCDSTGEELHSSSKWRVMADSAYRHEPRSECHPIVGLFEDFHGAKYPWGWQQVEFDDRDWPSAVELTRAVRPDNVGDSFMPHRLVPRIIPFLEETNGRFGAVVRCEGIEQEKCERLIRDDEHFQIPVNTTVKILYDVGHETTAYPELETSGGVGSSIQIKYAEVLRRNGKKLRIPDDRPFEVIGYWDRYWPGGGDERYEPFWWRTFRFVELTMTTADAPLTIRRFVFRFTGYPFKMRAQFESSDPDHAKMWQVSWRTLRLCAHETFEDCPYWEQLQYAGDTQLSALLSYYLAGDHLLARQALRHFDWSRNWEGITMSRYPSRVPQIIPFWSLHWIMMVHDYYYQTGDLNEVRHRFAGLISVLDWFDRLRDDNGLIAHVPYWCVADWSPDWHDPVWGAGIPPGTKDGASAMANLMYISSLKKVSELAKIIGKDALSKQLRQRAETMSDAANTTFWSEEEGLYTDRPDGPEVSQLTNAWAILSRVADKAKAKRIAQRLADDSTLCRAAFFGKFFVFRALSQAGAYKQVFALLQPWKDMLKMGCTTWPEDPSLGRSECHVWSSAPAYEFLAEVLGVKPLEPGFAKVLIHPNLGSLQWARGRVPTPRGDVEVNCRIEHDKFRIDGKVPEGVGARVILPSGTHKQVPLGGDFSFLEPAVKYY